MMTAAKIVETVPWIDAKYYAATQTMDEARHTEVFAKYLHTKLGEAYPMSPFLEEQITALLEDSRWDIAYLGMQIVIESLALAAFGSMLRTHRRAAAEEAAALRHVRRGPPRRVRRAQPGGVLPGPLRGRAQGPPGLPAREHPAQPGPLDHAGDLGADGRRRRGRAPVDHGGGGEAIQVHPFAGFQRGFFAKLVPTSASSACSTPTTATCAGSGARPACSSSSSPTTPRPTTRATTPWRRTGLQPPVREFCTPRVIRGSARLAFLSAG